MMGNRGMQKRIATACLAALAIIAAPAAQAQEPQRFIIIVDQGQPADAAAAKGAPAVSQSVANAMGLLSAEIPVGLIGYGDDLKQRCTNVNELAPVAPLRDGREALKAALPGKPDKKGRAPQITAISRAAAQLKSGNAKNGSIILLAHRADDCAADPCAAASAFHTQMRSVPVHVIAVQAPAASIAKLKCLAEKTGGLFQEVSAPDKAGSALLAAFGAKVPPPGVEASAAPKPETKETQAKAADVKAEAAKETPAKEAAAKPETKEAPAKEADAKAAAAKETPAKEAAAKPETKEAPAKEAAAKEAAAKDAASKDKESAAKEPTPAAPAATQARAVPAPPGKPAPEPNLILHASLGTGTPPLQQGVAYRIYPADGNPAAKNRPLAKPVWTGGGGESRLKLAPGKYTLEAAYGFMTARQPLAVGDEKSAEATIALNGGTIDVTAVAKSGGAPLSHMFYIAYASDGGGKWREAGRSSQARALFHVPAGDYKIVARHGEAQTETTVTMAAGGVKPVQVVMNCGVLTLSAQMTAGAAPLTGVRYSIYPAGQDRELARATLAEPSFVLPAGRYKAVAQHDLVRIEKEITMAAGDEKREDLVFNGAHLTLGAKLAGKGALSPRDVRFVLYSLDGGAETRIDAGPMAGLGRPLLLRGGRYRVESRYGTLNAVETAEVSLAAGETREQIFEHAAAQVKLAVVTQPRAKTAMRAQVKVTDASGAVVADLAEIPAQALILKPGKYQVNARSGAKTGSGEFEVAGHDQKTVEVLVK